MKNEPLVSIIVPAYNHKKYIGNCIDSALDQDYKNIELIVINDGSTDGTDAIIRKILDSSDKKFIYLSKENEGLIKTLNTGLSIAKGEYFCELASDDILPTTSIRERVHFLEQHLWCHAVFTNGITIDHNGEEVDEFFSKNKRGFTSNLHSLKDFIERTARIVFPTGMIKKSFIEDINFFDEDCRYFEDISVIYKMILRSNIGYIGKKLYAHREHNSNTADTQRMAVREEKIIVLHKLICTEKDTATKNVLKKELSRQYWNYYKFGKDKNIDVKKLQLALRNSIKARPLHIKSIKALYNMATLKLRNR